MQVISFIGTLPAKLLSNPHSDNAKYQTLLKFSQGVTAAGDQGIVHTGTVYQPCDVAVMLGWVHEHGKSAPHLSFRQMILDQQKSRGGRTVVADSNLFLYANRKNPHYYLRYSFDGVFPNTGEYCDLDPDPQRWIQIQQDMGIVVKQWRKKGSHILLGLQRNGGWSMAGYEVRDWTLSTIRQLRSYTNRVIRLRPHPGDKKSGRYLQEILQICQQEKLRGIEVSSQESLVDDLKDCWAMVNHNSSPAVGAVIEGIPAFVTDPVRSQCREVANTDLSRIENPEWPDRQRWLERISQFHWSHQDIVSGSAWQHMKKWVNK